MMIMRWCTVQINEYDLQAKTYPNISTRHDGWLYIYNDSLWPGGRLNKKDSLTRYGNSHVKDKTS